MHNDSSTRNRNVSETQKRFNDGEAADIEFEKVASNWIEFKPKCKKMFTKKELNLHNNERLCLCNNLWGVNMKVLVDKMIEESGSERKFGCLPEMCTKSPVQLGALTSESFSERMISNDNLLVDPHPLKFGDDMIDKLVVLRVNKTFNDKLRNDKAHSTMNFEKMDSTTRNKI